MRLGLGKSKQKTPLVETSTESLVAARLKELCGGDGDLYGAMSRLMFLDPKKITNSIDNVLADAQGFEAQGNRLRAEVGYRIAGGISLYKGDVAGVRKYFEKASSFSGDSHPEYQVLLKRSDEAVNVARKYYEEFTSTSTQS